MHYIKELKQHTRAWMLDFLPEYATGGNASQGWSPQVLTLDDVPDIGTNSHLEVIGIQPVWPLCHLMSGFVEIFHWLWEMDTAWWPHLKEGEVNLILNSCSDERIRKSMRPLSRLLDETLVCVA